MAATQDKCTPKSKPSKAEIDKKKRRFSRSTAYAVPKIKQNIKRMVRTNERFTGNVPSISDPALISLANMVMELGNKIVVSASEAANKVGKQTIGSNDILAGVNVELRGELMAHCVGYIKEELAKSSVKK